MYLVYMTYPPNNETTQGVSTLNPVKMHIGQLAMLEGHQCTLNYSLCVYTLLLKIARLVMCLERHSHRRAVFDQLLNVKIPYEQAMQIFSTERKIVSACGLIVSDCQVLLFFRMLCQKRDVQLAR